MNVKGTKKKNQVVKVNIFEQQEIISKAEVIMRNLKASTWHTISSTLSERILSYFHFPCSSSGSWILNSRMIASSTFGSFGSSITQYLPKPLSRLERSHICPADPRSAPAQTHDRTLHVPLMSSSYKILFFFPITFGTSIYTLRT